MKTRTTALLTLSLISCAVPRAAEEGGIGTDQLEVMFRAAIAQAKPFPPQKALCFEVQSTARLNRTEMPKGLRDRLARELGLPAYPASECGSDIYPFVIASREQAMLYSVRVEEAEERDVVRFWAIATYGNVGANGREYRLVMSAGKWVATPTGLMVVS